MARPGKQTKSAHKPKVAVPEPTDEEIYEDVEEPPPPTAQTINKKPSPVLTVTSMSTKTPAISLPLSGILSPLGKVSHCNKSSSLVAEPPRS